MREVHFVCLSFSKWLKINAKQRLFGACGRIVKVADFLVLAKNWRKKLLTDATFFLGSANERGLPCDKPLP